MHKVVDRVKERFTPEETDQLDRMLRVVGEELMPEVTIKKE